MTKGQAEALIPMIEAALGNRPKSDLNLIAVGIGPGNFTGTRIAVATARGLALSLGIPAIPVSNFELLFTPDAAPKARHTRRLPAPRETIYEQEFEAIRPIAPPRQIEKNATPDTLLNIPRRLIEYGAIKPIGTRPAPLYVRPADAALPSTPPVQILS